MPIIFTLMVLLGAALGAGGCRAYDRLTEGPECKTVGCHKRAKVGGYCRGHWEGGL